MLFCAFIQKAWFSFPHWVSPIISNFISPGFLPYVFPSAYPKRRLVVLGPRLFLFPVMMSSFEVPNMRSRAWSCGSWMVSLRLSSTTAQWLETGKGTLRGRGIIARLEVPYCSESQIDFRLEVRRYLRVGWDKWCSEGRLSSPSLLIAHGQEDDRFHGWFRRMRLTGRRRLSLFFDPALPPRGHHTRRNGACPHCKALVSREKKTLGIHWSDLFRQDLFSFINSGPLILPNQGGRQRNHS